MKKDIAWEELLEIRRWTPLRAVAAELLEISPGVYKLGECAYLATTPLDAQYSVSAEGPRILSLFWCVSDACISDVVGRNPVVVSQVELSRIRPPRPLLFGEISENINYSNILHAARQEKKSHSESDVLNASGQTVIKTITIDRREFFFPIDGPSIQVPIAIKVNLTS